MSDQDSRDPKPVSDRKVAANRANAQKSTGPRTEAGKERTRLNALTHGLRSQTVILPNEDRDAYQQLRIEWVNTLAPTDPIQLKHAQAVADADWMLDRFKRAETAHLAKRARRALDDDQIQRLAEVDDLVEKMPENPRMAALRLRSLPDGCSWLIQEINYLMSVFTVMEEWLTPDRDRMIMLCGRRPTDVFHDSFTADLFDALLTSCWNLNNTPAENWKQYPIPGEAAMSEVELEFRRMEILPCIHDGTHSAEGEGGHLIGRERLYARKEIEATFGREIARLESKRRELLEVAKADRAEAFDRAAFDPSPHAALMHRYETSLRRRFQSTYEFSMKLKKQKGDESSPVLEAEPLAPPPPLDAAPPDDPRLDPTPELAPALIETSRYLPIIPMGWCYDGPKMIPSSRFRSRMRSVMDNPFAPESLKQVEGYVLAGLSGPREWDKAHDPFRPVDANVLPWSNHPRH